MRQPHGSLALATVMLPLLYVATCALLFTAVPAKAELLANPMEAQLARVIAQLQAAAASKPVVYAETGDTPVGYTGVSSKSFCEEERPQDQRGAASPWTNCSIAVFAGGGFLRLRDAFLSKAQEPGSSGILKVNIGYTGGFWRNRPGKPPFTYLEVCAGRTGHSEAVMVFYDRSKLTYADLLLTYVDTVDTTPDAQRKGYRGFGNRVVYGRQYRSAVFVRNGDEAKTLRNHQETMWSTMKRRVATDIVTFDGYFFKETASDDSLLAMRKKADEQISARMNSAIDQDDARKKFLDRRAARDELAQKSNTSREDYVKQLNAAAQLTPPPLKAPIVTQSVRNDVVDFTFVALRPAAPPPTRRNEVARVAQQYRWNQAVQRMAEEAEKKRGPSDDPAAMVGDPPPTVG